MQLGRAQFKSNHHWHVISPHLTRNGAELHDRLQKLLCIPKMVKHGFGLSRYLDGVIENSLERV